MSEVIQYNLIFLKTVETKQQKENSKLLGLTANVSCGCYSPDSQFHNLNYFISLYMVFLSMYKCYLYLHIIS